MKKLLIFLMMAIPLIIIIVVNLTVNVVSGFVAISVDSISLNQTSIEAKIEETASLQALILPKNASNKNVIWQSTNEEVATVDLNGNVTFVGFGKGYITATTVDGNKTASCYFYVTDTKVHDIRLTSEDVQNGNYFVGIEKTLQLKSIVSPVEAINREVLYSSEDDEIATVDSNGLVYGLKEGRVKINAVSAENSEISDSVIVEVVKPVEQIIVDKEKVVIPANTYQLSYSIYPADASVTSVLYYCDNEEIATVSSAGLVKFKQRGKVVITLKTIEGGKTANVEIEYTDGFATDLILEKTSIDASIEEGGTYIQYTTVPSSVDVPVEFSSDDEDVAYVDDSGYVQFIGGGSTIIRARIKQAETEYIEKVVFVYIHSPATGIVIEDSIITAKSSYQLLPKSYPETSTNERFFYHSTDTDKAVVDEDGVVTFLSENPCEIKIIIYANENLSDVMKEVTLNYTKGYLVDLILQSSEIVLEFGDYAQIHYEITPSDAENNVDFRVKSQNGINGNDVIQVLADGTIKTLGGGSAVVEVSALKSNGEFVKKECNVTVVKKVDEINVDIDLDEYNGEYITSSQEVSFNFSSQTLDATDKTILWKISSGEAVKKGENTIFFNSQGLVVVTVYSRDGNCFKDISIRYLKDTLISAKFRQEPQNLNYGEIFEFEVLSTLPANDQAKISIKINQEITANPSGKVLSIVDNNKILVVGGGEASITVSVFNLQFTYNIKTIREAEEILVTPNNITTTNERVVLQTQVFPEDATNKEVKFEISDEEIAYLDGSTLIFRKNGKVEIRAYIEDGSATEFNFTMEKVDKGTGDVPITGEPVSMQVGDTNELNFDEVDFEYETLEIVIKEQNPLELGKDVIEINDKIIRAIGLGQAVIEIIFTDKFGVEKIISIEVSVIHLSEDIEYLGDLEMSFEDYVSAVENIEMDFGILPQTTTNKNYNITILKFISQDGQNYPPYLQGNELIFRALGTAVIRVDSADGNSSKQFRFKYTGGDAIDATINVSEEEFLSIGESLTLDVLKWIPSNTKNKQILIRETSHTQGVAKVVEINGTTITAIAGGKSEIMVELSGGIVKNFAINVLKMVEEVQITNDGLVNDELLLSQSEITIKTSVLPANATNKNLEFVIEGNENVSLEGNKLSFKKPGSVYLTIKTTDGSNIEKRIKVTSTFGYIGKIELYTYSRNLNKGASFILSLKNYYPMDATFNDISYKVLSSQANDMSENTVVEISDGNIRGVYGGNAVVRVFAVDYYGNEVYADCQINVISPVESFEIIFDKELKESLGSLAVSSEILGFETKVYPSDANSKDVICVSKNESIAIIEGQKIVFQKVGKVLIDFILEDDVSGRKVKTYSFNYTGGNLIEISIDESDFINKTLSMNAEEEYLFKIKNYLPSDVENIELAIKNKRENRVDQEKEVVKLENGKLKALNGGTASFELWANNLKIGDFIVIVTRECLEIGLEDDKDVIYINNNIYDIIAKAEPSDTLQTKLCYEVVEGRATVNEHGRVIFAINDYNSVQIKISCFEKPSVIRIITIEYSNQVKKIEFSQSSDSIYVNESLVLSIVPEPFNCGEFDVVFEIVEGRGLANLNVLTNGSCKFIAGANGGTVKVRAYVKENPEIFAEKTIEITPILTQLELDLVTKEQNGNNGGIGGYTVWGTQFLTEGGEVTNKFKLALSKFSPANAGIGLIWKSSDENIARVSGTLKLSIEGKLVCEGSNGTIIIGEKLYSYIYDDQKNVLTLKLGDKTFTGENGSIVIEEVVVNEGKESTIKATFNYEYDSQAGVVEFLSQGKVTITVEPERQYSDINPLFSSYTFNIVEGINVNSFDQLVLSQTTKDGISTYKTAVLQSDISTKVPISLLTNLFGNGYKIEWTNNDASTKISVKNSNIIIDNVQLRGNNFDKNSALSQFDKKGKIIDIRGNLKNIKITNSIIENAMILIEVKGSNAEIKGCIVRNSFSAGVLLSRDNESYIPANVTIDDCVLSDSMFGCILIQPEAEEKNLNNKSKAQVGENVKIYNWTELNDFARSVKSYVEEHTSPAIANELGNVLKDILAISPTDYKYVEGNGVYLMLGGVVIEEVKGSLAGIGLLNFKSIGSISFSGSNYSNMILQGTLLLGTVNYRVSIMSVTNSSKYIPPKATYVADKKLFDSIKQPMPVA